MARQRPQTPKNPLGRVHTTYRYLMGNKDEGELTAIANENQTIRNNLAPENLRAQVLEEMETASRLGICVADLAECSLRLQHDHLLVTRAGAWASRLLDEDLIVAKRTDSDAVLADLPTQWEWHRAIYASDKRAQAIFLGQTRAAMRLVEQDNGIEYLGSVAKSLGLTLQEAESSSKPQIYGDLVLIQKIGILAWANSLAKAIMLLEKINFYCEAHT